jgi:chitin disaccharide deacetylase
MKALIVNADDFGMTPGVNRAIIDCHTQGIVTSATLMVNMPAYEDAVRLAREHASLAVGLHFNITQGRPVSDPALIPSLLNERGEFLGTSGRLAKRALAGRLRKDEVIWELGAQINRAITAGLNLTHIDSHKHAHALPLVFDAVVQTIGDYGIHAVRTPRDRFKFEFTNFKQRMVAAGLSLLCLMNSTSLRRSGLRTNDWFLGVAQTGRWTKAWLLDQIAALPEGLHELMCHPGYEDEALGDVKTRLRESRAVEARLLMDPEVAAQLRRFNVQLATYSPLVS